MTPRARRSAALAVPAAVALLVLAASALVLWLDLQPGERQSTAAILTAPRIALAVLLSLVLAAAVAVLAWRAFARTVEPARRLAESTRLIVQGNPGHRLGNADSGALGDLAAAVDELAA